jgi:hypothetical protein
LLGIEGSDGALEMLEAAVADTRDSDLLEFAGSTRELCEAAIEHASGQQAPDE